MTLYFNKKQAKFLEKAANIEILLIFKEQNKVGGSVKVDLAEYANNQEKSAFETKKLDKCPDKNAKISFEIMLTQKENNDVSFSGKNDSKLYEKHQKPRFF